MIRSIAYLAGAAALGLAAPAQSAILVFKTVLSGANERPTPIVTGGTGTALVVIDDVANRMRVQANFSGLTSGVAAAHIHCCADANNTAGVATATPTFPGFPSGVTAGSYNRLFDLLDAATYRGGFITANGGTVAGARNAFLTGMSGGLTYFNIHTELNPSGEIRGQLAAAVPEPASWALMLAGFGLIGTAARHGRRTALA